jgi:GNAT superfamily N-acetyltransferase
VTTKWPVAEVDAADAELTPLLRAYMAEMISRYHGRPAREDEIDAEFAADTRTPPRMLLARYDDRPLGCVGLRTLDACTAEVTRVFIDPVARGTGGGAALLGAAHTLARSLGMTRIRLDTRSDLVEARRLYARHGYREIPAYNDGPYAQHWFEKALTP